MWALKRRDNEGNVLRLGVAFKWVKELRLLDIEVFRGVKFKSLETEVEEQVVDIDIYAEVQ